MSASQVLRSPTQLRRPLPIEQSKKPFLQQQQQEFETQPLQPPAQQSLLIEDEVHGVIELPSHIQEIVQHPLFQRLKQIHQLGLIPWSIDKKANHKRYDHCLGAYKSAQDHLRAIERNSHYEPKLPDWCRLAVEIAALLHDIGHGPMSHAWELLNHHQFDHEENALACVDLIFNDALNQELVSLRDDGSGRGVQLIKALILGCSDSLSFPMMGHTYIFDIVHNRRCGLDVDKWDYLRRDNKRLKVLNAAEMDFDDVFLQARISADGQRIEYRYQDYHRIYRLFEARWRLHIASYQHPLTCAIDIIFGSAVQRIAPELLKIRSKDPDWLILHDDHVLKKIESDPIYKYIREPQRIAEVSSKNGSGSNIIRVHRKIPGPWEAMKSDEAFAFFGNKSKKRPITPCLKTTIINKCYKLE
ncbi:deoxynucleoside triphosphate triphosphohydrolase SAMHD1 homolog isoform X1 [Drosophila ficusphila]|uniref:deoxynucleoside triphosphate triphosphohydrolase SAMHD1 homolog isoform X1 n=1 Tax=Drosophila ficusphila TaxID=30025 RepID=UPI0007E70EDE|nr:deoxynucleoside triphosphate triphosphohydrolase SAMHD1 homolog isoform X1 [Drosophila ficusphila]